MSAASLRVEKSKTGGRQVVVGHRNDQTVSVHASVVNAQPRKRGSFAGDFGYGVAVAGRSTRLHSLEPPLLRYRP